MTEDEKRVSLADAVVDFLGLGPEINKVREPCCEAPEFARDCGENFCINCSADW